MDGRTDVEERTNARARNERTMDERVELERVVVVARRRGMNARDECATVEVPLGARRGAGMQCVHALFTHTRHERHERLSSHHRWCVGGLDEGTLSRVMTHDESNHESHLVVYPPRTAHVAPTDGWMVGWMDFKLTAARRHEETRERTSEG